MLYILSISDQCMVLFLIKIHNNQLTDILLSIPAILGLIPTGGMLSTERTVRVSLNRKFSLLLSHLGAMYAVEQTGKEGHYSHG